MFVLEEWFVSIFLSYIFLGLSLAAPIGPINAAQLDKGLKNGFFHSWFVGLGAMAADAIYMILVYLGFVQFLEIPVVKLFLWLFGFFVLVYTGVESIVGAGTIVHTSTRRNEPLIRSFLSGFIMSLSNPLSILFWLGIYGSVLAKTITNYSTDQLLLYSGAIFIGLLIWDITMALIASSFRRILTPTIQIGISILSGLSLIGFGCYFGFQAYKLFMS
jgi:threonine/homoserine/homoserine lactone efflux protein